MVAFVTGAKSPPDVSVIVAVPGLEEHCRLPSQDHEFMEAIEWTWDSESLLSITSEPMVLDEDHQDQDTPRLYMINLPFHTGNAEHGSRNSEWSLLAANVTACRPHPYLPVCALAHGDDDGDILLSVIDLMTHSVVDEHSTSGTIADMCWSVDGRMLYAIVRDGTALLYRVPATYL